MPALIEYDLTLEEVPFAVKHKDGTRHTYVMRELTGALRDAYLTGIGNRMKYTAKGDPQGLQNFDGLQASLLIRGVYNAVLDSDNNVTSVGEAVTLDELKQWPARVQEDIHTRLKKMSAIGDEAVAAEKTEKND